MNRKIVEDLILEFISDLEEVINFGVGSTGKILPDYIKNTVLHKWKKRIIVEKK